jgi:hypothetical protein
LLTRFVAFAPPAAPQSLLIFVRCTSLALVNSNAIVSTQPRTLAPHRPLHPFSPARVGEIRPDKSLDTENGQAQHFNMTTGDSLPQKNPFAEFHTVSWKNVLSAYPSDANNQVVWVKGKIAQVSELGSHVCPMHAFDTVAFICMSPVVLSISTESQQFYSVESFPLQITVDLSAKPLGDDFSLIAIATRFDESLILLTRHICTFLHNESKVLKGLGISDHETQLETELVKSIKAQCNALRLPFELLTAHLKITCCAVMGNAEKESIEVIQHGLALHQEERRAEIERKRRESNLEQVNDDLKAAAAQFKNKMEVAIAEAETEAERDRMRLDFLKSMESLCGEAKIAAFRQHPELAEQIANIQIVKISNDTESRQRATEEVIKQFQLLAEISRAANPSSTSPVITNINNS